MLDYKLIEALSAVIEEGGFEKGAGKLHITQSAVSQRVKLLEEQTGQILIKRTTPPEATIAGKKFLKHFIQVKTLENSFLSDFKKERIKGFDTLLIGMNSDSLATWFLPAVESFLSSEKRVVDIQIDDQEETHKMLKNGVVMGCISSKKISVVGCSTTELGGMNYRLLATPEFIKKWFPDGFTKKRVKKAPAVIFNKKDNLHGKVLKKVFSGKITGYPVHFVPSTEMFAEFIFKGLGYGMIPDLQGKKSIESREVVELAHEHNIITKLYWHRWSINWSPLEKLTEKLEEYCRKNLF